MLSRFIAHGYKPAYRRPGNKGKTVRFRSLELTASRQLGACAGVPLLDPNPAEQTLRNQRHFAIARVLRARLRVFLGHQGLRTPQSVQALSQLVARDNRLECSCRCSRAGNNIR